MKALEPLFKGGTTNEYNTFNLSSTWQRWPNSRETLYERLRCAAYLYIKCGHANPFNLGRNVARIAQEQGLINQFVPGGEVKSVHKLLSPDGDIGISPDHLVVWWLFKLINSRTAKQCALCNVAMWIFPAAELPKITATQPLSRGPSNARRPLSVKCFVLRNVNRRRRWPKCNGLFTLFWHKSEGDRYHQWEGTLNQKEWSPGTHGRNTDHTGNGGWGSTVVAANTVGK